MVDAKRQRNDDNNNNKRWMGTTMPGDNAKEKPKKNGCQRKTECETFLIQSGDIAHCSTNVTLRKTRERWPFACREMKPARFPIPTISSSAQQQIDSVSADRQPSADACFVYYFFVFICGRELLPVVATVNVIHRHILSIENWNANSE